MIDLHPSYFHCLKIYPLPRLYISRSLLSSTSALDLLSHFCFAFRVALVSFFLPFFLSRSILSFSPFSRSSSVSPRSSSPSVSACSNMATRCPITRLVFATVFPPSYICHIFADGCDEERVLINLRGNTPFYFFAFFSAMQSIHSYSSISIAIHRMIVLLCLLLRCKRPSDIRCKLKNHVAPSGTTKKWLKNYRHEYQNASRTTLRENALFISLSSSPFSLTNLIIDSDSLSIRFRLARVQKTSKKRTRLVKSSYFATFGKCDSF